MRLLFTVQNRGEQSVVREGGDLLKIQVLLEIIITVMETAQRTRNDKENHSSDRINNAEILESRSRP